MNDEIVRDLTKIKRNNWVLRNINNLKIKNRTLNIFTVVCPLFHFGRLSESELIVSPIDLSESRIFCKWLEFIDFVKILEKECKRNGLKLEINIVFADKLVPLKQKNVQIRKILDRHLGIWEKEAKELEAMVDCKVNKIVTASSLFPNIADSFLIDSVEQINSDSEMMSEILRLSEEILTKNLQKDIFLLENTKKIGVVRRLRKVFGFNTTIALVLSYIFLDRRLAILFKDQLNVSIERFGLLHAVSRLTPELDSIPRVEITVE